MWLPRPTKATARLSPMRRRTFLRHSLGPLSAAGLLSAAPLRAVPRPIPALRVAVSSNFAPTARQLSPRFEQDSGHRIDLIPGASGKLYAQIKNGAPFDVFMSADDELPQRLEAEGLALAGSRLIYAIGQLVLWSPQRQWIAPSPDPGKGQIAILQQAAFRHLALAHPKLAPYGRAAWATLKAWGLLDTLRTRLVWGDSVAQAYQFIATGHAELGFVALSQVLGTPGHYGLVPPAPDRPLTQSAVVLKASRQADVAGLWLAWLRAETNRPALHQAGYLTAP